MDRWQREFCSFSMKKKRKEKQIYRCFLVCHMIAHLPAVNVCNISTFPVCLHLQTTAIFNIFHLVIAPRERRCSRRFIFRTHSPPTLASMESRACVTRKNVHVEPDADWLETRNVPPPCSPLMGMGPPFLSIQPK